MHWWDAVVLGIIQGVGEFLPISSSGHLVLARAWMGEERVPQNLAFDALLHLATALSVIVVFHREVAQVLTGFPRLLSPSTWKRDFDGHAGFRTLVCIAVSAVPALAVGLMFKAFLSTFRERADVVSMVLIATGCWLLVASRFAPGHRRLGLKEAAAMGVAQSVSVIFPGFSRSGSTIGTGLLCGVAREAVGPFAFLMALVPNLGAAVLKGREMLREGAADAGAPVVVGCFAAFVVGVAALRWLLPFVRRGSLRPFGWYCLVVGIVSTAHLVLHVF